MIADPTSFRLNEIACGDCVEVMRGWPDAAVNCVVTSPPYWGLRSYAGEQERVWGGDDGCEHEWADETLEAVTGTGGNWQQAENGPGLATGKHQTRFRGDVNAAAVKERVTIRRGFCLRCGAWRGALGLEPTPSLYVEHIIAIFREVRRVLHPRGTVFLNLGDSYAGSGGAHANEVNPGISQSFRRFGGAGDTTGTDGYERSNRNGRGRGGPVADLKPKDLCMMPARVALALQADGWWLRSEITWCKLSPMPESVTDRPTSATEKVYLLTKGEDYWYDAEAVRQPHKRDWDPANNGGSIGNRGSTWHLDARGHARGEHLEPARKHPGGRNLWNYWVLGPEPMGWEMCRACQRVYSPKQHGRLPTIAVNGAFHTACRCGRHDAWLSHFATFTPTLASRCLLAGCPPKVCATCGEPWARRVEAEGGSIGHGDWTDKSRAMEAGMSAGSGAKTKRGDGTYRRRDLGYFPACECGTEETRPGVAFDPFMGSGTVALAALKLGRSFLGCEISEEYVALAEARIAPARAQTRLEM